MIKKFFSKKISKVILIVAVFGLLIFFNPAGFFSPFRTVIHTIFSPFQKVAYIASMKISNARDFVSSISDIKKENERLITENLKLSSENAELTDLKRQNETLKKQLNLLPREQFELEATYVIGQDPEGFSSWMEISKGKSHGLKEGMLVIVSNGVLVGKIGEVSINSSQVILITNPQSVINAMVAGSETKGVVRGEYGLGIILDMILQTDTVNAGDKVITSGIGNNIPRGLLLGTVRDVQPSPDRLFQQATVKSPVELSKLEVVFVIKNEAPRS